MNITDKGPLGSWRGSGRAWAGRSIAGQGIGLGAAFDGRSLKFGPFSADLLTEV
jgi:hypothetical protein